MDKYLLFDSTQTKLTIIVTRLFLSTLCLLIFSQIGFTQNELVPIADEYKLVGGTKNGKWFKAKDIYKTIQKDTKFFEFDLNFDKKNRELYGNLLNSPTGCGSNFISFTKKKTNTPLPMNADFFEKSIRTSTLKLGANANWNPFIRKPINLSVKSNKLKKTVISFLKSKGFINPNVKIRKIIKVDLEGDGQNEILLEASYNKPFDPDKNNWVNAGDYSFVLMQKVIYSKINNILIEGDFHPTITGKKDYTSKFEILSIIDLNGDSKMEVVLKGLYSYGGDSTEVFEINGNKFTNVLSEECGD